jgi:hypothetical protein
LQIIESNLEQFIVTREAYEVVLGPVNGEPGLIREPADVGWAVETLCVIRERFWLNNGFYRYFPQQLIYQITQGWGSTPPLGVHDCRTSRTTRRN